VIAGPGMQSILSPDDGANMDLTSVRAYYDETWLDYRLLWITPATPAIHFGYWDEKTKRHEVALCNLNRVLATHVGITSGQRILDAGCGVGGSAIWLAETFDVEVVGITLVASQVARARGYAAARGVTNRVTFAQQSYLATTFSPASFDVVWGMESACHAPDKRRFLAEARRVLRPGGRLGLIEYMRVERQFSPADEALLQSWLAGWAIPHLATHNQWISWARELGFSQIETVDITENVVPSLRHLYRMAVVVWPFERAFHALRLRSAVQHGNVRGSRDQYRALRQGLWFDALVTATASPE
jgi:cyclopropane fatty-acyl-phospholipid synthase-like methyltransferase